MKLYLDTETRSDVNLKKHGLYRYTQGKKFDVILLSWAIDDEPPHVWDIANTGYKAIPKRLASALTNPKTEFLIHNSGFDRTVMAVKKLANIPVERTVDTMVMALAHGLPASLDMLGKALGLPDEMTKMDEGRRLIRLFCNVRKDGWFNNINTHPEDWALFKQYALMDIVAMRECYKRMPKANYPTLEHRFWQVDQKINARGIPVDVEFAEAAVREAEVEKETLDVLTVDLTKGAVARTTQRDKFKEYLKERFDIDMPDMQAPTIERRLMDPDLPVAARTLLETRVQASQNAAAKYLTILNHHDGGRMKNTLQMYGASRTGRDCLAEGTLVLVKSEGGEILERPIQDVKLTDLVWDGIEWVEHEGVICKGTQPVIEHDGIVGTPDHEVFLSDTESVTLQEAKDRGIELWKGNIPFIS